MMGNGLSRLTYLISFGGWREEPGIKTIYFRESTVNLHLLRHRIPGTPICGGGNGLGACMYYAGTSELPNSLHV